MNKFNLVLSGGGVRSYAHLGVYKYCYEKNFIFREIVAVSGGSLVAPFIFLRKNPEDVIELFKKAKIHKMLFPFWFIPNNFECLFTQPTTLKVGEWIEKQFKTEELEVMQKSRLIHIMATKNPKCGIKAMYTDMLQITALKHAIAASCAISGIFKEHKIEECSYIDGGHWTNCPLFYDFNDNCLPLIAVNLGYTGQVKKENGRISKIMMGLEVGSFARVQEDMKRWDFEKKCNQRGELIVLNPEAWDIQSLNFNLKEKQIDELINAGYKSAEKTLNTISKSLLQKP